MVYTKEIIDELVKNGAATIEQVTIQSVSISIKTSSPRAIIRIAEEIDGDAAEFENGIATGKHELGKVRGFSVPIGMLRLALHECGNAGHWAASKIDVTVAATEITDALRGCTLNIVRHHIKPDEEYITDDNKTIVNKYDWFATHIENIVLTNDTRLNALINDPVAAKATPGSLAERALKMKYGVTNI